MKKLYLSLALGAMLTAAPAQAQADDLEDTAARFGVRASILDISLSPSGNKIVWVSAGPEHSEIVNVVDLTDGQVRQITQNTEQIGDITRCDWSTDSRLICQLAGMAEGRSGILLPFSRMFAINDDGTEARVLSERQSSRALGFAQDGGNIVALDVSGSENSILVTREHVPEDSTGTRLSSSKKGLGVDVLDTLSGRRKIEEQPDELAGSYVADENGNVRLKTRWFYDARGFLTGERVHMYREDGSNRWRELEDVTIDGKLRERISPVAFNARSNSIYGFDKLNGYDVIVEVAADGSGAGKVIMARDDVDVDGLIRIGRQRRVVGAAYATEKPQVKYFDDELAQLAQGLSKALPNQPIINIVGANSDESRLLIVASSDTDPGTVYLYDKASRNLQQLLAVREFLVNRPMGEMKPITFAAKDGTEIPGYLTLPAGSDGKNLPAVVMPHGGPGSRDVWGFDWLVQFFTARGYAVLQPNFRGSSGYGAAWYGRNGFQQWEVSINDVNDAGRWLIDQGIADSEKMAIVGWSYGGYAALQSQVVDPDLYKAVVGIAPVTDLDWLRDDARRYTNSELVEEYVGSGPHIDAGSPLRHAEKFKAPVALFHGTMDVNVDVRHSRAMQDRLEDAGKRVTYSEYEGLEHSLRDSKVRSEMLMEIDKFLSAALGS